jgi:hypothetical protein
LEIVPNFSYLGITFSKSGSFNAAKKDLVNKGTKAMYEVLKKGRLHNLSIQCQLDIFDKTVKPILLYGCDCLFQIYDIPQSFKIPRILFNQAHATFLFWKSFIYNSLYDNDEIFKYGHKKLVPFIN